MYITALDIIIPIIALIIGARVGMRVAPTLLNMLRRDASKTSKKLKSYKEEV